MTVEFNIENLPGFKYYQEIREVYKEVLPHIKVYGGISPYFYPWVLTPIEYYVWVHIRANNLNLYPQVPCGKYFIDFANPKLRLAIEVDGKDYHSEEKDRDKTEFLIKEGYRLIRFTGTQTWRRDFGEIFNQSLKGY
ncbi:endonuclease domain-containing protein [Flagellimonas nanhaiensis]|uniref:DUF559 domain-containing protein n=1 Tax=Flagellimonas nanhaiensis TaxID=2292706 RepID=A0A371JNT4_9FLAO|nr:DUF559 domain-containing protein [Allomuricauda nanhaiensis]RDY58909.1 DUF559 domain-containing protein [Allomuricauda nanhaiensis]